jgi:hypothetical protein
MRSENVEAKDGGVPIPFSLAVVSGPHENLADGDTMIDVILTVKWREYVG